MFCEATPVVKVFIYSRYKIKVKVKVSRDRPRWAKGFRVG